jgi:hypothetical protein
LTCRELAAFQISVLIAVLLFASGASAVGDAGTPDLYGRFLGTWDVSYAIAAKDGTMHHNLGQVTYVRILDGQAVQATWTTDLHSKELKPYGASIIFYDPKHETWSEVWIYPAQGMTTLMHGGKDGDRIVMTGHDADGALLRWSLNDIEPESFLWRGEISHDDGKTWQLQGENQIHRHHG